MSAPLEFLELIAEVVRTYPVTWMEYDPLPSGVCFFWVSIGEREFVIEYHPTRETGVSENFPDTPPFVGHDEVYPSLTDAIRRFKAMLADAAQSQAAGAKSTHAYVLHDKKT
ncbi:MAG: hypothetical protein L0Y58_03785 [Verrucomicrobia subdivision 3 bacterium]|nr:hypothetical protein [Limisphaerales bacterium]